MSKIKGVKVSLITRQQVGIDPLNAPIYDEVKVGVDNVLISPVSSDDAATALALTGRKAVYTLGIPKGDTHTWEGSKVEFFGKVWMAFGVPTEGIDNLIPLEWNKKVLVERYE